jgi:chromosome segregation ATPase
MLKKSVKKYKQKNSYSYRINIAKQDNLDNDVYVINQDEKDHIDKLTNDYQKLEKNYQGLLNKHNPLESENKELKQTIISLKQSIIDKDKVNDDYVIKLAKFEESSKIKDGTIQKYEANIKDLHDRDRLNSHILGILYERIDNISKTGFIDRLKGKPKSDALTTISTVKPKLLELNHEDE